MKVLVIGYGSMGQRHATHAERVRCEVAVCEKDTARRKEATVAKRRAFHRLSDALKWGPDAVVIATPVADHAALLAAVRAKGLSAYVEKPLARGLLDLGAVHLTTADLKGVPPLQVGYNLRAHEGLRHMHRHQLPRVGAPIAARLEVSCDMATWPGKGYGDALLECSHELDLARWLLGDCEVDGAVSAQEGRVWEILLRHASGCVTSVRIDGRRKGYRRGGSIEGTDGTLRWQWQPEESDGGRWIFRSAFTATGTRRVAASLAKEVAPEHTYARALHDFLHCVATGVTTACGLADGIAVLVLVDMARKLAEPMETAPKTEQLTGRPG